MGSKLSRSKTSEDDHDKEVKHLNSVSQPTKDKNENTCPIPRPPRKRKKDILPDVSVLKHIDDHVMKTPSFEERSIETLGEYLIRPATSDIEKVRAFYKWVTENIRYDTDTFFGRANRTKSYDPASLLASKSSVCDGYATIFQLLCNYAGIPVKKISGHSKGYSYKPGFEFTENTKTNHAWNAVYINGEWRFIETTWGAGQLDENNKFSKNFSEFYFLTDPKLFIVDHFPCIDKDMVQNSKWQLLKKPISLEVFSERCKPSRHAREWGIKFCSHTFNVIEMDKNVDISFKTKHCLLQDVNLKLYNSNGSHKDQFAFIRKHSKSKMYTVTVCPRVTGEYRLEIYGTVDVDSNALMQCLITYIIKCNSISNDLNLMPKFGSCYGPVADCQERGFLNVEKIPTSMTSKTGELSLSFKVKDGTKVMAVLKNCDDVKLEKYTLLEMNKQLHLRVRLPKKSYYRLVIHSQFQSDKYTPAINILVNNLKESYIPCPFPKTFPETLKFKCSLLEPLSYEIPAKTDVRFRFSSPEISEALLLRESVPKKTNNSWDTVIKTPPYGEVNISAKNPGESSAWLVYSFKVK